MDAIISIFDSVENYFNLFIFLKLRILPILLIIIA